MGTGVSGERFEATLTHESDVVFDVPLPSAVPANALTTLHRIQGGTGCFATGQATALPWQKHSREINQRLCTGCHHHLNRFGS
jgi:hypothetical protein|tara:strand:- start:611 stop:859 length:249 start_codon:yes stop_codon:yes gene_type:complete